MLAPLASVTVSTLQAAIAAASVGVSQSTPFRVGRNASNLSTVMSAARIEAEPKPAIHAAANVVRKARIRVSFG